MKKLTLILSIVFILFFCSCSSSRHVDDLSHDCKVLEAAYAGDEAVLREELKRGCNPQGNTSQVNEPIYHAIANGQRGSVAILLDAGIDVNFDWGIKGGNLLTNAVQFEQIQIVELLLARGAKTERTAGHSPLYRSIIIDNEKIQNLLISNGAKLNELDKSALEQLGLGER